MSDRDAFAADYNVPRGTMASFDRYADLLVDWQQRMNLVGPSTVGDIWQRHFADSAQLAALAPEGGRWLDIGSGAGFPGVVVALLGEREVLLVESVAKKCRFLAAVIEEFSLGLRVGVANCRVEALPGFTAGTITARACAPLDQLFDWGLRFADRSTRWLLPKGARVDDEIAAARHGFDFDADLIPSRTEPTARIVVAANVRRKAHRR